jgi:hypothetical protein
MEVTLFGSYQMEPFDLRQQQPRKFLWLRGVVEAAAD